MDSIDCPEIDISRCDGCGLCVPACTSGALGLEAGKAVLLRPDLCRWDSACELACPRDAIHVPYLVVFGSDVKRTGSGRL